MRGKGGAQVDTTTTSADTPQMEHPNDKILKDGITFDDVLIVPAYSDFTPENAETGTLLTRSIALNIPLVSAPMDTVTESALAIALAQEGGIGIIHKNLSPERQAREVSRVKRSENGVISDPITLGPEDSVAQATSLMVDHGVSGFPVTADGSSRGRVLGILTRRDLTFLHGEDSTAPVGEVMTRESLVTAPAGTSPAEAEALMSRGRVEKLLLVSPDGCLAGLMTMRDLENVTDHPHACRDERGRLRVGAALGPHQFDRAESLVNAEVDVLVVDTAHGHSKNVLDTVRELKSNYDIDVIAGNVATPEGALALVEAGADAVKVGIGPGSICTTRVVTGIGLPQVTAVMDVVAAVDGLGVPVIADGGIRMSGDIAKALAAGASSVMLGSLLAGLDESPGELILHRGRRFKSYRGMGSSGAMGAGSADRYGQSGIAETRKFVPEGVEGMVPYRGELADIVYQMVGGVRAAMGYCGTPDVASFRRDARFVRISAASMVESHPHDITITKEAANYTSNSRFEG